LNEAVFYSSISFYCFSGAPTATLQSWPGCPCGGLILAPLVLLPVLLLAGKLTAGAGVAVWFITGCAVAGAPPFSGAPTATLQSWPGCPCGGFIPAVPVLLPCGKVAVLPGDAGVDVAGCVTTGFVSLEVPVLPALSLQATTLQSTAALKMSFFMCYSYI
jgi:hypothetical protein